LTKVFECDSVFLNDNDKSLLIVVFRRVMSTHFIIDFKKKSVSEIYGVMSTLIIIDNEKSILLVLA